MGGDLNLKKSWNPALVKNQQKVWQKEQEKLDEFKQVKQRNAEYEQEQQYAKLLNLRHGGDLLAIDDDEKKKVNKMDWMYVGSAPTNQPQGLTDKGEFTEGRAKAEQILAGKGVLSGAGKRSGERFSKVLGGGKGKVGVSDDPMAFVQLMGRDGRDGVVRRDRRDGSDRSGSRRDDRSRRNHRSYVPSRDAPRRDAPSRDDRYKHPDRRRERSPTRPS